MQEQQDAEFANSIQRSSAWCHTRKTASVLPIISLSLNLDWAWGAQAVSREGKWQSASVGQTHPHGEAESRSQHRSLCSPKPAHTLSQGAEPRQAKAESHTGPKSQGWFLRGWLLCHPHPCRNIAGGLVTTAIPQNLSNPEQPVASGKWLHAVLAGWQALALLYILWLRVKEVSRLPRCCSLTPALLRSAGMVWDFLSAAVCLASQASCTLQGEHTQGLGSSSSHSIMELHKAPGWRPLPSKTPAWGNPSRTDHTSLLLQKALGLTAEQGCCSGSRDAAGTHLTCSWLGGTLPTCARLSLGVACRSCRGGKGQGAEVRGPCSELSRTPDQLGFAQRGGSWALPTSAGAGSMGMTPHPNTRWKDAVPGNISLPHVSEVK